MDIQAHRQKFETYLSRYDRTNGPIRLKIEHTYAVCRVMDRLTASLGLSPELSALASLCALYHDIARFSQAVQYGTFNDALSFDHAQRSGEILEEEGFLDDLPPAERQRVLTAIRRHNKYSVGPVQDGETLLLCRLIRDADKCDIFRVFACDDMVDMIGESAEQVARETVSAPVAESVLAHRCVERSDRKTGLDRWIGFLGFFYDLNFPQSIRIVKEEGYYRMPFDRTAFADPATQQTVDRILAEIERYIRSRSE